MCDDSQETARRGSQRPELAERWIVSSDALDTANEVPSGNPALTRRRLLAVADGAAWLVGTVLAVALRMEFTLSPLGWAGTLALGVGAGILQIAVGYGFAIYRGRFPLGSFEEVRVLALSVAGLAFALSLVVIPLGNSVQVPRGTVLLAAPFVLVLMLAVRYLARLALDKARKPGSDAEPAIIIGAGHMGDRFLYTVLTDPEAPIRPVALLDDDPAKHRLHLRGVPVRGRVFDLDDVARRTGATILVIAIGGADSALLRDLTDRGERAGLRVVVTPSLTDLMLGGTSRVDARDVRIEDLIGRHPVDTNVELIAGYITGKRVLVTGRAGRSAPSCAGSWRGSGRASSSCWTVTRPASRARS